MGGLLQEETRDLLVYRLIGKDTTEHVPAVAVVVIMSRSRQAGSKMYVVARL